MTPNVKSHEKKTPHWPTRMLIQFKKVWTYQLLAAFSAMITFLISGVHISWTSVYIPQLQTNGSTIQITSDEGTWITVSLNIGGLVGGAASLLVVDKLGRKTVLLLCTVPLFLSSVLLIFADTLLMFCMARFFAGVPFGATLAITPMYLGEIAHSKIRGSLGVCITIFDLIGSLMINVVGEYLSIKQTSLLVLGLTLLFFVTFVWAPESPYYLIMVNKLESAEQSLQKFRSKSDVKDEFERIKLAVREQVGNVGKFKELFSVKTNRNALLILFFVLNGTQMTGDYAVEAYAQDIFSKVSENIAPIWTSVIYYGTKLVAFMFSAFLVDRLGRRPLALASFLVTSIALLLVAICIHLEDHTSFQFDGNMKCVPLLVLLTYAIFFSFLESIPIILLGELFPMNVKAFVSLLYIVYYFAITTGIVNFFQITSDSFGMDVPFFVFAGSCLVHLVLVFVFVFETKERTLEEIQEDLRTLTRK